MSNAVTLPQQRHQLTQVFSTYFEMCKPRVVALMLVTSIVGMLLATPTFVSLKLMFFALVGIGLTSCGGAVINHLLDRDFDSLMIRTKGRPIPSGTITPTKALIFALVITITGLGLLVLYVNWLTALLTLLTFFGYAVVYTVYLKHATPQNIVIGGAAGAMPPVLGWTAVTGHIDPNSLLLFLIIFVWTPPHFWSLAVHRYKEYSKAKIPMLPVTHGIEFTKLNILLYTILLFVIAILPYAVEMSGIIYLVGVLMLNCGFLYWAWRLKYRPQAGDAMKIFF